MSPLHISLHTRTLVLCYYAIIHVANSLSFDYPYFKNGDVNWEGDASPYKGTIQITSNSLDQNNNYSVGRVTSLEQMLLWDLSSGKLSDFTTKFSFVVFSKTSNYGDGMVFFMADPNLPLLKNIKEGGGLGLVDGDQLLNSTQHSFVALEFDTFNNPSWDPFGQGPHVGFNFNSMRSIITKPWFTNILQWSVYNCSIHYNSTTFNLSVSFTMYSDDKPVEDYISYKVDLRDFLPEKVIVGFSAATGILYEVHTLRSWSFHSSLLRDETRYQITAPITSPISGKENKIGLKIGLGIGTGLAASLSGLICTLLWKRSKRRKEEFSFDLNMDDEFQKGTGPKRFSYNELMSATNKFSEAYKVGQGGFGGVYKGYLKELNSYVAIKRISRESRQGIQEYATEVKVISQLRHRNLVQLLGWCHKKNDFLLVYEFMSNGSLDSHLYGDKSSLTWTVRYKIAFGLASALLYLQEEWEQCVIHRDIKSSNIMLDSCFNAKLGDFGLARLVDHEKGSQTTLIAGTRGYIAPEYFTSGKATKESDIYSFGVVLLEIASGRKAIEREEKEGQISVVEWVWELYGLGKLHEACDPKLCGAFDEKQLECLVIVGLWCVHPDYLFRPCIRHVIQVLKFESPLPILPEKMPVPTYFPSTMKTLFSSVSSTYWTKS
ncbi:L-type lectin-domain containing receptor kinase IX.1-like [Cicer arietinum]|uniref:L-type lectin-domain containing receptor kinase IX.1-like n=1 Tax=Cicer arietinum TaxID=3827 RepID=A0A1S2YI70_CICAR|nr:L-type lectin-domain containing receptor kinase IX.1-like [Cicer arietinum]